jgi:hypothetical protein
MKVISILQDGRITLKIWRQPGQGPFRQRAQIHGAATQGTRDGGVHEAGHTIIHSDFANAAL